MTIIEARYKEPYTFVERILRATYGADKLHPTAKHKASTHGVNSNVHHDDTKEPASLVNTNRQPQTKWTDWNAGAADARDTIEKPEARTAKDWNSPAKARVPGGREEVTSRPISRTMNNVHSIALL